MQENLEKLILNFIANFLNTACEKANKTKKFDDLTSTIIFSEKSQYWNSKILVNWQINKLKVVLIRYQRGDQGPDDDLNHSEIGVDTNTVITDIIVPPIGGPNVCRSRSRTFCCPGWHQRDSTGTVIQNQ